jgi:hypothetical protein
MAIVDRKKLAQLARRLKVAKARYASLNKRAGTIETRRAELEAKASRLVTLLGSKKGQAATAARQRSIEAQFIKANKEAQRLGKQETKIYDEMRKVEEKIGNLKAGAKAKNPKGKHLAGATAKQQRQYEAIKRSELKRGEDVKTAKRIAAATVRVRNISGRIRFIKGEYTGMTGVIQSIIQKRYSKEPTTYRIQIDGFPKPGGWNGRVTATEDQIESMRTNPKRKNKTIIKAKRVVVIKNKSAKKAAKGKRVKVRNAYVDLVIKGKAKKTPDGWRIGGKTFAQGRGTTKLSSGYYLDKHTGTVYSKRERNAAKKTRKRNLDHKDSTHQVQVSKHWRSGGLSQWQRAHHAGQHDLFSHGIKARAKHNPNAKDSAKWEKLWSAYIKALADLDKPSKGAMSRTKWARLAKAEKAIQAFDPDAYRRLIAGKAHERRNPNATTAKSSHRPAKTVRAGSSRVRSARKSKKVASKSRKVATVKRARKNPSAEETRQKFAGSITGSKTLYYPVGTPQGVMAKLGKLVSITTARGTIKPVAGTAWLVADTRGKLHIGSTSPVPLFDGPKQSFGKVSQIEYEDVKKHLGYNKPQIFFHHVGEENGKKPTLETDGKGGLCFKGGDYRITSRGLEN